MTVYFIQAGNTNVVKIGYTKNNPSERLRGLQTGNPVKLRVIATIEDGTYKDEDDIHSKLKDIRLEGEWFAFEEDTFSKLDIGYIIEFDKDIVEKELKFNINSNRLIREIGKLKALLFVERTINLEMRKEKINTHRLLRDNNTEIQSLTEKLMKLEKKQKKKSRMFDNFFDDIDDDEYWGLT